MTAALTQTPLQAAEAAQAQAQQTRSRWVQQERAARQEAAAARTKLASVQLEEPETAFDLMAVIDDADRRAAAAETLAQAARSRVSASRTERDYQEGLEMQAAAGRLWSTWLDHETTTRALLAQLQAHEGTSFELPPRHTPTLGEAMRDAARAMDAEASTLIVGARGGYVVARPGPVIDGQRDMHVGYGAPARESGAVAYHRFEVTVDGQSWELGSLQANTTPERIEWVTRPVPAAATVVVTSRTSGDSFTVPPAESEVGTR